MPAAAMTAPRFPAGDEEESHPVIRAMMRHMQVLCMRSSSTTPLIVTCQRCHPPPWRYTGYLHHHSGDDPGHHPACAGSPGRDHSTESPGCTAPWLGCWDYSPGPGKSVKAKSLQQSGRWGCVLKAAERWGTYCRRAKKPDAAPSRLMAGPGRDVQGAGNGGSWRHSTYTAFCLLFMVQIQMSRDLYACALWDKFYFFHSTILKYIKLIKKKKTFFFY